MSCRKFIIKYLADGELLFKYKEVFADTPDEARETFQKVMGDSNTFVSIWQQV